VNWKQIGHAMDRPEQLNTNGARISRGLFAPAISYHKGIFYIVCTLIDQGGNFVITAKDPAGPWSNPVWLKEVDGIDPSLFFDEDDKAYIVYNSIPPDNKSLWDGHRTIRMYDFDYENLKVTGEERLIVNGGTDISKKPVWIEGPHIYHINDWYYLMCAEGGTGYHHSEVVFRSKNVYGPFIPFEGNPILTQRHLDTDRKNPVTTAGHADLVETKDGKWYAVFLACRPYEGLHFNTGRETFMLPVRWENDWPIITKGEEPVQYSYPVPNSSTQKVDNPFSGNFSFRDDFSNSQPDQRYIFLRTPLEKWYSTTEKQGKLTLQLRAQTISGLENPSFIGFRQSHNKATVTIKLDFSPQAENEKAGLVIFQNENHFYYLCKSVGNGQSLVELYRSTGTEDMELLRSENLSAQDKSVFLRIEPDNALYHFYFSADNKSWKKMESLDARFLSTETASGFVGCVFGLYATSLGKSSNSKAFFDWFEYEGKD
jgi:alpha-N-arabinofuranosidase